MGVTMAEYKPYSGGRPVIVANAMPWGKTMTEPVSPAKKSAFIDSFVTNLNQTRKGNIDSNFIYKLIVYFLDFNDKNYRLKGKTG